MPADLPGPSACRQTQRCHDAKRQGQRDQHAVILRLVAQAPQFKLHILVDMTPLDPGGQNGGAGLVATALVRHLSALNPYLKLTLLTADVSHAELAALDSQNVERRCVVTRKTAVGRSTRFLDSLVPTRARVRLKSAYRSLRASRQSSQ